MDLWNKQQSPVLILRARMKIGRFGRFGYAANGITGCWRC